MEGVSKLRARFEMLGQTEGGSGEKTNPPPRPSSPASGRPSSPASGRPSSPASGRPSSPASGRPSSPALKHSNPPRRPPPPTPLEKAQARRLSGSPVSYGSEDRVAAGQGEQSGDAKRPLHPLEKSKSKSVSDIKSILVGTKDSAGENGAASQGKKSDEVDGPATVKKEGKKGKKSKEDSDVGKKKSKEDSDGGRKKSKEDSDGGRKKSKEESDVGKSGMMKLSSWLNFKGKSSEAKNSPKSSPLFGRSRNASAPTTDQQSSPPSSSPQQQSPDLSARTDSPDGARGGSKKEALKKSESTLPDFAGGATKVPKRTDRVLRSTKSASGVERSAHETLPEEREEEKMEEEKEKEKEKEKEERKVEVQSPSASASPHFVEEVKRESGLSVKELAKHAHDTVLKEAGKELTAAKLEPVLRKELACLTGGLESERHPIITIPEVGLKKLDTPTTFEELKSTLAYFRNIINPDHISNGATLLIDARGPNTHKPAKHLLEQLAEKEKSIPMAVHMVYILVKAGGILSSMFRNKPLIPAETAAKFHLAYLNDPKQAVEQLGAGNLTTEMGGSITYQHTTWLENRLQFERMVHLHKKAMEKLPETKKALDHYEVPTTVKDAENLMQADLLLKENMINLFAESELKMDQFLASLREQQEKQKRMDVAVMMSSVGDMVKEIKGHQNEFDKFWKVHRSHVEHMMSICHFTRTGEKMKKLMQGHIEDMADDKIVLGDTLEAALEQGEKHEAFATKCIQTMDEQMSNLKRDAATLCNPVFATPGESESSAMHQTMQKAIEAIRSQLSELTKMYEQLMSTCQQKRDLFIVCVKFHNDMRQLQHWNEEVLHLLASQPLDQPTPSAALNLMNQIEQSLNKMSPSQVANLKELAATLYGKTLKRRYETASKKYEDTRNLLEQRKLYLQKILSSHFPQTLNPTSLQVVIPSDSEVQNEVDMPADRSTTPIGEGDYTDHESDPGVLKNRQFVYRELIATEQDYIKDLSTVIDSYYDEMDPESLSIPLRLRGKRDTVFGNLLDLKNFHENTFNRALESYADCPERIGECFTEHTVQFQMYSLYCKNRTNSETLINESTESQAFFKGIQLKLGHALHLNSYLLKPIQRITKYQLLLKDMMKYAMQAKRAHSELQTALESMLKVLKNLNDSLHVVGLKGFPGSLAEQGRLLVHDPFQVSDSTGRFSRSRERHVFLFEKVVILSKMIEAPVQKRERKSDTYIYKDHIQMALVNLREMLDKPLQFQITIHGQNKMYTFQASVRNVREMWTKEIRRLLQAQFMLMKDIVIQSGTLDRSNYRGKARPFNRDSRLFGDSFRAPHGMTPKRSLGRFFKKKNKKLEAKNDKKLSSRLDTTVSLPPGMGNAIRPSSSHPLTATTESEGSEDTKCDSLSSDDEVAFSSDEEDGLHTTAVDHYESLAPGVPRYYTALSDYSPDTTDNGVKLSSGQEVEVIGINKYGWWWVRSTNHYTNETEEGWVPASYLQMSVDQSLPPPPPVEMDYPARSSALRGKKS